MPEVDQHSLFTSEPLWPSIREAILAGLGKAGDAFLPQ